MKSTASFWKTTDLNRHLEGMGGIRALLPIAIPMIISNLFETLMTVIDRLFMSYVDKVQMAACMGGGLTAWTCMTLFVGIISYASAMVARSYGAGRKPECPAIITQSLYMGLFSYPLILLIGYLASKTFSWAGHDAVEIHYELIYFRYILIGGGILALLRTAVASFFAGLGKTRTIMEANILALITNVTANYILIFGKCGFPALGIHGAAIGTILASVVMTGKLFWEYRKYCRSAEYCNPHILRFSRELFRPLFRFGLPNGIDGFLSCSAFAIAISALHSFGTDAAAALTIVMNWDMCAFMPLVGIQVGVTTLVSQCLGAGNPEEAERAAYSGFKLTVAYTSVLLLLFLFIPGFLVRIYTPSGTEIDYSGVIPLAVPMLRAAAFYLIFDGAYLNFSGALRGGGDTFRAMIIGLVYHWFLAGELVFTIYALKWPILSCWYTWVACTCTGAGWIYLRFRKGHWKNFNILEQDSKTC